MKPLHHIPQTLTILQFIILSVMAVACNRAPKTLEFEPIDGQIALLARVYPVWFGEKIDIQSQESGIETLCDWIQYKALVAQKSEGWEESQQVFLDNEMSLVTQTNIHSDYWASIAAFEWLESIYNGDTSQKSEILAKCEKYTPNLKDHLDNEIQLFQQIAQKEGWLDANGKIAGSKRDIVRLMHRYQWISVTANQFPIDRIFPPEEKLAVFRYQIEISAMPIDNKIAHINIMRNELPGSYDYDFAEATLYSRVGDTAKACAVLKNALPNMHDENQKKKYNEALRSLSQANSAACL